MTNPISTPKASAAASAFHYQFQGVISAESQPEMVKLVESAQTSQDVHLDFVKVTRINSMGVALLLKALKELKQRGKSITITGTNKMTQMLFKMMGIGNWATIK
jgi:anti-anti-sigma factor